MKIVLFLLLLFVGLTSCNTVSNNNGNETQGLDISNPQNFIESFTKIRKEKHNEIKDFQINSEVVILNSDFFAVNFSEKIGEYKYQYCIVINPTEKLAKIHDIQATYEEIIAFLDKQNISYNFFVGNLKQSIDFTNDGSPDYILTYENNFRTSTTNYSELILFNGKSDLKITKVIAHSDFESGVCENFIGVKEELIIRYL